MKKMIFVIDMINGFCKEGALADPKIMNIVPELHKFLEEYEGDKIEVRDSHPDDALEFQTFPVHCMKDSYESEGIMELKDVLADSKLVFLKNSTCALFAPGMMEFLKNEKPEEIVVTGCCTDICIQNFAIALRNFFDEMNMDVEIVVPKNAVETYHIPEVHDRKVNNERAYTVMENTGIKLVKTLERRNLNEN